jgi:hypothetical protein
MLAPIMGRHPTHPTIVLAHGAGAPMDSPFMDTVTGGLEHHGLRVMRFNFPYMERRMADGRRRPPDRPAVLRQTWLQVVQGLGRPGDLIIGGKSMGGRVASLIADEVGVRGLVCLGYPFHPAGKPDQLRIEPLREIATPTLILQGTRDALGNRDEVRGYPLSAQVQVELIEDGDHSFKPRVRSGRTAEQNLRQAVDAVVAFVRRL